MDLAKPCLDVGVYTDRYEELRSFWEGEVGLPYDELLKAGRGVHQHRLRLPHGSIFKLNSARDALPEAPTRFGLLTIATDAVTEPTPLADPDGTSVALVPVGHDGVTGIRVDWATSDVARLRDLLVGGFDAIDEGHAGLRVGSTLLRLVEDRDTPPVTTMRARRGLRYLTVQVRDVRAEHARLLGLGWIEGTPPIKLGETAFISFVRDPDGSSVEVSQRASLTGPLPDA